MDRLDEINFTYKTLKDGKILIYWHGKLIKTVKGDRAFHLEEELECCSSDRDIQFCLARVTGNFKRGNERLGKNRRF